MKKIKLKVLTLASASGIIGVMFGCTSIHQNPAIETLTETQNQTTTTTGVSNSNSPFVEAEVEYEGVSSDWAGLAAFTIRASSRESGLLAVSISPKLFSKDKKFKAIPLEGGRAPASMPNALTTDVFRERLANLANQMNEGDILVNGCVASFKVKFIRQDFSIIEKQGCRTQMGWPRRVSEEVSLWIQSGQETGFAQL